MDLSGYTLLSVLLTFCISVCGQDTLTVRQVFDFEVGDVFHYGEDASDYMPGGFYYKLDRITIVDKWYSQEGDTLFYKRHLEGYTTNLVPSGGEYPYEVRYYFHTAEDEMYYTDLDSTVFRYLAEGHFSYLKDYTHGPPESEISDSIVYESENYCSRTANTDLSGHPATGYITERISTNPKGCCMISIS